MKIILYIVAAILIFFGVLFIWAAFDPSTPDGYIMVGVISVAIGLVLIWLSTRIKPSGAGDTNVTVNVDLPSNVSMDTFKCQSCGGALTPDNVKMVAGAPVVTCPYCNTSYQLKEEPKW
jgi:hypothetical protein